MMANVPQMTQNLSSASSLGKAEIAFSDQMVILIDYCNILSALYELTPISSTLDKPVSIIELLVNSLNMWQTSLYITQQAPAYGSDFFGLACATKRIIKSYRSSEITDDIKNLNLQINKINNHLSEYYVTIGNYEDAEIYLMHSLAETMSDKQEFITHITIARLKISSLNNDVPADKKAELFSISKHNLTVVKDKLKNVKDLSIEGDLLRFISEISNTLTMFAHTIFPKVQPELSSYYEDIKGLIKIAYEISLTLQATFSKMLSSCSAQEYSQFLARDLYPLVKEGLAKTTSSLLTQIRLLDALMLAAQINDNQYNITTQQSVQKALKQPLSSNKTIPVTKTTIKKPEPQQIKPIKQRQKSINSKERTKPEPNKMANLEALAAQITPLATLQQSQPVPLPTAHI